MVSAITHQGAIGKRNRWMRSRSFDIVVAMTTTESPASLEALRHLGFSEIEALVYAYLLRHRPSTAYRISHAIAKPTANTYKAVASLEGRGAVQVDDGGNRLVRAVPPRELLALLDRDFRRKKKLAEGALSHLHRRAGDDRLYVLRRPEQVLERARSMLRRARRVVVADLFPGPLRELEKDLVRAARRGVRVAVKVYGPVEELGVIPSLTLLAPPRPVEVLEAWPGQQITLVMDAEEHLLGLFDAEMTEVRQAVWSRSTYLSCQHHNLVAMEMVTTAWEQGRAVSAEEAERRFRQTHELSLLRLQPPGLWRLRERFGRAAGAAGPEPASELDESSDRNRKENQP